MSGDTFSYHGQTYRFYYGRNGVADERTVELPIVWEEVVAAYEGRRRVLEVGNVLAQYYQIEHDVLDKYERRSAQQKHGQFITEDAAFWRPKEPYDFIVSVSTLEHVGSTADPKRVGYKPIVAIYNLMLYGLVPGGRMLLTWPWGYHAMLDDVAARGLLDFVTLRALKKVGRREWAECGIEDLAGIRYNRPFPKGNAVIVAEIVC